MNSKQCVKSVLNHFLIFVIIFTGLFLLLIAATAIPNRLIEYNQSEALEIIDSEGEYPHHFFVDPAISDNYTDRIIIEHTLRNEQVSVIEAAMHSDYITYWHGYCVVLRPLLVFLSFYQIRYIAMISYIVLFGCAAVLIAKRVNTQSAVAFMLAIAMTYPVVVMTSLQFLPVFLISFAAIILEMLFPSLMKEKAAAFFMIIGMVTSFVDFLTAPLITLGLPLIVLIIGVKEDESSLKTAIKRLIGLSAMWVLGYGMNWACKWVISSVVLNRNTIADAASSIRFRTMGNADIPGKLLSDRFLAVRENLLTISPGYHNSLLLALFVFALIVLCVFCRTKQPRLKLISVLFIGIYPYLWYMVLSNHSIVHCFFTYRSQVITVFAIFAVLLNSINWDILRFPHKYSD